MSELYQELNIKLVLLGRGGVGKTSLCNALEHKEIPKKYIPTIGSSISRKEYEVKKKDFNIVVNLWDIGGQRKFNFNISSYFKNTDVAFLIFDVSKPEESIKGLRETYLEPLISQISESLIVLVGNKIDLDFNENKIKPLLSEEHLDGFPILFTSALKKVNVQNVISYAVYNYLVEKDRELNEDGVDISSKDFLNTINNSKSEMKQMPINVKDISSAKIKTTSPIKIKERREELEGIIESKRYQYLQERFEDLEEIQGNLKHNFARNMNFIEESITNLRKIPIRFLIEEINGILGQLQTFQTDFEEKLNISFKIDEVSQQGKKEGKS